MTQEGIPGGYTSTYRTNEMRVLASWVASGVSGSVVGLIGCGRSNLLRFVCEHPAVLHSYLPPMQQQVVLVSVDLYDLPSDTLADLYRTLLHAFYWIREQLPPVLAQKVYDLYLEHRAITDAFVTQKALYELLLAFQRAQTRVVLVMNRFDYFCTTSTPQMVNTLRGLRDRFKETLSYIVGMRQEVAYLSDPTVLGDMYELFDSHICYVGAMTADDSRDVLASLVRAAPFKLSDTQTATILRLSGGFPSLLKVIGQWWMLSASHLPQSDDWGAILIDDVAVQHRLERLWQGLTQEEKLALSEVHKHHLTSQQALQVRAEAMPLPSASYKRSLSVVQRLFEKGCCVYDGFAWRINGELLAAFVQRYTGRIRGRIWLDEMAGLIYQGEQQIEGFTPLEFAILRFLILHPRMRHTSDTIIDNTWPEDDNREAITPNNLQVHISSIRKKIEPNPAKARFLITWHGRPGGYLFFPEGKPE